MRRDGTEQPAEPRVRGRAAKTLPVAEVDRCRDDPHEHLPGARHRHRDVLDAEHLGRAVAVATTAFIGTPAYAKAMHATARARHPPGHPGSRSAYCV